MNRYDRRLARIARWDRPIDGAFGRVHAWANMLIADHGAVRLLYPNRSRVSPEVWRSSQPSPGQIAWFASRGGKTIVNLRGGRENGSWPLERDACTRHGLALEEITIRSREAPDRATILAAKDLFARAEYPMLAHCKSGADRAGLFAALYLLLREEAPAAQARRQLSLRFGHFRHAKTGILDDFLQAFAEEGEACGMAFLDWVEHVYDPASLSRRARPRFWSSLMSDRLIRRE